MKEWRIRSSILGHQVRIRQGERTLFGQALDVDEQGGLTVMAGDVENLRLVETPSRSTRPSRRGPRRL